MILEEFSVFYIVLTQWVPPLITILIGGYLASILFPKWRDSIVRTRATEDRKLALAEDLSKCLTRYLLNWNRLRTISELEMSRNTGLTEIEHERKKQFVSDRNDSRDHLIDVMASAEIYFSHEVQDAIEQFKTWDEANSAMRINELPSSSEFDARKRKLLNAIHSEIEK